MTSKIRIQYKNAQLCSQVRDIASLALGSSADLRLSQLLVHSVTTRANGARLTIYVTSAHVRDFDAIDDLMSALAGAKSWLRQQIAQDINRKRAPDIDLQFIFPHEELP